MATPRAEAANPPTLKHGKICHVELPTTDLERSASFYERVFDWHARRHPGGAVTFDDSTGEVSGHWVPGRAPADPGALIYIWVDDIDVAIDRVRAEGCEIVQGVGADPGELTARFRDPGGNIIGLYEEPRD
jgi:predicted enzyme related to lactoylglutathione lyase